MNATLQHLDLECNKVGDAAAAAIASALSANKALRVLSFSSMQRQNLLSYSNVPCLPGERATYNPTYMRLTLGAQPQFKLYR